MPQHKRDLTIAIGVKDLGVRAQLSHMRRELAGFERHTSRTLATVNRFGAGILRAAGGVTLLGGAVAALGAHSFGNFLDWADDVDTFSKSVGFGGEAFQIYAAQAKEANV